MFFRPFSTVGIAHMNINMRSSHVLKGSKTRNFFIGIDSLQFRGTQSIPTAMPSTLTVNLVLEFALMKRDESE